MTLAVLYRVVSRFLALFSRTEAYTPPYGNVGGRELCESRGGRSGLPVANNPCGLCGRKATSNLKPEDSFIQPILQGNSLFSVIDQETHDTAADLDVDMK